jgi:hypothetical protein
MIEFEEGVFFSRATTGGCFGFGVAGTGWIVVVIAMRTPRWALCIVL